MSKRRNSSQLDLNLSSKAPKSELRQGSGAPVVQFIDSATLQVRQEAVRRVAANGIFSLHPNLRRD